MWSQYPWKGKKGIRDRRFLAQLAIFHLDHDVTFDEKSGKNCYFLKDGTVDQFSPTLNDVCGRRIIKEGLKKL